MHETIIKSKKNSTFHKLGRFIKKWWCKTSYTIILEFCACFSLIFSLWICILSLILGSAHGLESPTVKLSNGNQMPIVGFGTHFVIIQTLLHTFSMKTLYKEFFVDIWTLQLYSKWNLSKLVSILMRNGKFRHLHW